MFLRSNNRKKDGKDHRYFSIVENHRISSGKTVQRTVLYLGEINDQQQSAWRKSLSVFDEQQQEYANLSLFPADLEIPADAIDSLQVKLSGLELRRPRLFGSCWLASELWRQLGLHEFWDARLAGSREDVPWEKVLQLLVVNRLLDPGSEFRVHRQWYLTTAMDALLGTDFAVAEKDRLYRCLDRVLEHKQELFLWLRQKWADLFQAEFEILLYDLTSTYFEGAMEENLKAKYGHSRDKRTDCLQLVIALVITTDGFPLPSLVQLLMRLGAAKSEAGRAYQFVQMQVHKEGQQVTRETFQFRVDKKKLQEAEWRDGHYLLRSNLTAGDPSVLWNRYVQLTQIESVFRSLKSELGIRPIYHQLEHRADAHILIAFLAYCLQVTLKHRLLLHAPGLTPTAVLEKLAEIKMIDVWIPTVDQRWLILPRYTHPSPDTKLLIEKLRLELPNQPPPRLVAQKEGNEIEVQTSR